MGTWTFNTNKCEGRDTNHDDYENNGDSDDNDSNDYNYNNSSSNSTSRVSNLVMVVKVVIVVFFCCFSVSASASRIGSSLVILLSAVNKALTY